MKAWTETAATWLLYLFAFAWPWGVYELVPVVGLPLTVFIAALVVLLAGVHALLNRRPRIPFEVAWPLAAICVALWYDAARSGSDWPVGETGLMLFCVAVIQLRPSRPAILQCLRLSVTAGGCIATLSLLCRIGYLMPTAFPVNFERAATALDRIVGYPFFAFAPNLTDAICVLAVCGAIGGYFAYAGRGSLVVRTRALLDAALCITVLALTVPWLAGHADHWTPPEYGNLTGPGWIAAGLALWIVARVAAKSIVAKQDDPAGGHGLFITVLAVVAAFSLFVWPGAGLWLAFLLGAAVVYAQGRGEAPDLELGWRAAAVAPVLLFAAIGIVHVDPGNPRDPRNVDFTLTPLFWDEDVPEVWNHLSAYEDIFGADRRLYLWRARLALASGRPHWAAACFRKAYPPDTVKTPATLPRPTPSQGEAFLVEMRDFVSAAGDKRLTFAHDRVLIAMDRGSAALSSLEHQTRRYADGDGREGSDTLAEAIAWLLEDPNLVAPLSEWPNERLVALLKRWDAQVETAPDAVPDAILPLVLIGHVAADGSRVYVSVADSRVVDDINESLPRKPGDATWEWVGWTAELEADRLTARLHAQSDADVKEAARVSVGYGGQIEGPDGALGIAETPDVPAILVWLP